MQTKPLRQMLHFEYVFICFIIESFSIVTSTVTCLPGKLMGPKMLGFVI